MTERLKRKPNLRASISRTMKMIYDQMNDKNIQKSENDIQITDMYCEAIVTTWKIHIMEKITKKLHLFKKNNGHRSVQRLDIRIKESKPSN